jgi:hypothetical protein
MKATAIGFIILEAFIALWLGAVARHGPSGLGLVALAYLLIAPALTWWSAGRFASRSRLQRGLIVVGVGVLMAGLAPAVLLTMDRIEQVLGERAIAATRICEVRDEPILSRRGEEIGVRVSYVIDLSATVNAAGIIPVLHSLNPADAVLYLGATRRQVDGRLYSTGRLETGRHQFVVDMYPFIVGLDQQGEPCISGAGSPAGAASAQGQLGIEIGETNFGYAWRGGREETTAHAYDIAAMHRNVLAGGLPACQRITD